MPQTTIANQILDTLHASSYRPMTDSDLAKVLCRKPDEHRLFDLALEELRQRGQVLVTGRRELLPTAPGHVLIGKYSAARGGYGFCIPDTPTPFGDLFIPPGHHGGAVSGDRVVARVRKKGKRNGEMVYEGRVVDILERGRGQFVGTVQRKKDRYFIQADNNAFPQPILIPDARAAGAKAGDHVVVQITEYPDIDTEARGAIIEVLGRTGAPEVDIAGIIRSHDIPDVFPDACPTQAREIAEAYDPDIDLDTREDLRKHTILTIDPTDARDFDDAISVEPLKDGWELGVHIADVAHFIPAGSALDREARTRGNSSTLR